MLELKDYITIGIAVLAVIFTYAQIKISNANLRLELYKKRFYIYESMTNLYQSMFDANTSISHSEIKSKLYNISIVIKDASFLFPKSSPIHTTLKKMNDVAPTMIDINGTINFEDRMAADDFYKEQLDILGNQMDIYLRFETARGWHLFK